MKQKLIVALLASALGGMAATTAHAGVLQASYKVYAAEAVNDNAVALTAPVISYNLSRPLSGTAANPNNFTVTLTISAGEWTVAPNAELRTPDNVIGLDGAPGVISADKKSVSYAFTVNDGTTYPVNSTITFGADTIGGGAGSAVAGKVDKLAAQLGMPADSCNPSERKVDASIKLTNASSVEFDSNDPNSDTVESIFASNVALKVSTVASSAYGTLGAAGSNESAQIDVLNPSLGNRFTASPLTAGTAKVNLGAVMIQDRGTFFDRNGDVPYSVTDTSTFGADVGNDGAVAAAALNMVVTGKFVTNGSLFLAANADCTGPLTGGTATINAARDTATFAFAITGAQWALLAAPNATGAAANTRAAYVCYDHNVANANVIPAAQFAVTSGTLTKGTVSLEGTNNVCGSNLYNLTTNGVQIDVRNYIHAGQSAAANGWTSTLRLINTDENQTVDVLAQYINSDGTLISSGKIATLAPRAAKYVGNDVVQAALGALPADNNNSRLRITAAGSSLRVQNYIYDPVRGTYIEASSAQGDEGPRGNLTQVDTHK